MSIITRSKLAIELGDKTDGKCLYTMFTLRSQYSHLLQISQKHAARKRATKFFLKTRRYIRHLFQIPPKAPAPSSCRNRLSVPVFCACLNFHLHPIACNAVDGLLCAYAQHFYLRTFADRYDGLAGRTAA